MVVLLLIFILFPCNIANAQKATYQTTKESSLVTRANKLVWKYKVIDGKLYRRLYDLTQNKWIGEWTLVP